MCISHMIGSGEGDRLLHPLPKIRPWDVRWCHISRHYWTIIAFWFRVPFINVQYVSNSFVGRLNLNGPDGDDDIAPIKTSVDDAIRVIKSVTGARRRQILYSAWVPRDKVKRTCMKRPHVLIIFTAQALKLMNCPTRIYVTKYFLVLNYCSSSKQKPRTTCTYTCATCTRVSSDETVFCLFYLKVFASCFYIFIYLFIFFFNRCSGQTIADMLAFSKSFRNQRCLFSMYGRDVKRYFLQIVHRNICYLKRGDGHWMYLVKGYCSKL
jgi:hypothetical protein